MSRLSRLISRSPQPCHCGCMPDIVPEGTGFTVTCERCYEALWPRVYAITKSEAVRQWNHAVVEND